MVIELGDIFKNADDGEENQETAETQNPDAMKPHPARLFVPERPDTGLAHENEEEEEDEDEDAYQVELENQYLDNFEPDEEVLIDVNPFRPGEMDNGAYAEAVNAYYEEQNYPLAIEKFQIAIKSEEDITNKSPNEIVAKSMYWQAESYVKTDAFPEAITVLESLIKLFLQGEGQHYLVVAAQRRLETLKARKS